MGCLNIIKLLAPFIIFKNSFVCAAPKHGLSHLSQIGFVMPYIHLFIFTITAARSAVHFGQSLSPSVSWCLWQYARNDFLICFFSFGTLFLIGVCLGFGINREKNPIFIIPFFDCLFTFFFSLFLFKKKERKEKSNKKEKRERKLYYNKIIKLGNTSFIFLLKFFYLKVYFNRVIFQCLWRFYQAFLFSPRL